MKKARSTSRKTPGELRPEYEFDYRKAKRNPYAARLKGRAVAVVLDPDVAAVFPDSEAVNSQLRSLVTAVPRRSRRSIVARRPAVEQVDAADEARAKARRRRGPRS